MSSQNSISSLQEHILTVAEHLLNREVNGDFTMAQLAEAAQVSRATIYRHLGNKETLLMRLAEERGLSVDLSDIRTRILQASRTVFGRFGFINATMEQVAQEAQVGIATVYRHFGDKERLVQAFIEEYAPHQALAGIRAHSSGDLEADLIHIASTLLHALARNRDLIHLLFVQGEQIHHFIDHLPQAPQRTAHQLTDFFAVQIEANALQGNAQEMALAFLGMILSFGALAPLYYHIPLQEPERIAHFITHIFLYGQKGTIQ